ncbi:hypothetical protein CDD82_2676 [Ophiocordyceps australis]|uniref:Uncharacterized protein n=1 Tax=Ophiocordyceps australis TaxID=1399860 RepID=A0A2C5ZTC9_9HYPO|nr:hypothetical protein CDD82_2676 [Ophiocordyceps australis]
MKAAIYLAACWASSAFALVQHDWSFERIPDSGLNDITFSFNVADAPRDTGFYFAQQFSFENNSEVAYTGIQPQSDVNGAKAIRAIFSTFQDGAMSRDPNCYKGADGGPGVSCAVLITGDYASTYNIRVTHVWVRTWRGTIINTSNGQETRIGQWTLPNVGRIENGQAGFVEYFPWNSMPSHECSNLPKTQVTFFNPTSRTHGASGGKIRKPYENQGCKGQVDFAVDSVDNGWKVQVGF